MNFRRLGFLTLLAAFACSSDSGEPAYGNPLLITVDTIGGIPYVTNEGDAPRWESELVLSLGSIGSVGEPAPDEFDRVSSAILSPSNELFVANSGTSEIRVFDLEGSLLRTIGRRGQGPGEFLGISSLSFVGNTLLALDSGNGRIGLLSLNGEWQGQRIAPGRVSGSGINLFQLGPDETYAWSMERGDAGMSLTYVEHSEGGVGDTIPQRPRPEAPNSNVICNTPDGSMHFFATPFAPQFRQHPHRGGLVAVTSTSRYRIALVTPTGDTTRVFDRTRSQLPVTDSEWEAGNAEYRAFRAEWEDAPCSPRSPTRPAMKPFIADLIIDTDGRFWVEVNLANGTAWEVFSPEGELLGTVEAHSRGDRAAPYFTHEYIVLVSTDSLDVEGVDVYRLDPS